jgi:hypothetical protein
LSILEVYSAIAIMPNAAFAKIAALKINAGG